MWSIVRKSAERYAMQVDAAGAKQYDAVYPVLLEFGASVMGSPS